MLAFLFPGVSSQLPEVDSRRDGRVELSVSILQSAKCWNVTQAKREERICLRLCDIYVCRKLVNVRLLLDIDDLVTISGVNISDPKFLT